MHHMGVLRSLSTNLEVSEGEGRVYVVKHYVKLFMWALNDLCQCFVGLIVGGADWE